MGTTLDNGIYLPDEGERNCYEGLAGNWVALDNHLGSTNIHVTINDKQAWNGHVADTTIHVTAADKQAWNGHVADSVKHVTAEDKQAWNGKQDALSQTQLDAVNSGIDSTKVQQIATNTSDISSLQSGKANDSNVVHKSGNETISGNKTFSYNMTLYNSSASVNPPALFFKNKKVVMGSTTDIGSQNITFRDSADTNLSILKTSCENVGNTSFEISVYNKDSNNQTVSGGMLITQTSANTYITPKTDNAVLFGSTNRRWSKIYGIQYYYGSNNVEFSQKFVTTDTAQTISGNKTFSKINGVEPGSLGMPDIDNRIDISSYITDLSSAGNTYTPTVNGWICIRSANATKISVLDSVTNIGNGTTSNTATYLTVTTPVVANRKVIIRAVCTTLSSAYFIPCQGNV